MRLSLSVSISVFITNALAFTLPDGVCKFDANPYTGGWYEIASSYEIGETMEQGCICPVAWYSTNVTNSTTLDITNSCIRNGQFYSVHGNAFPANPGEPGGDLHFSISGNTTGLDSPNYIVLKQYFTDLESNAPQYALVGGPTENQWWLLSRSPNWNDNIWYNAVYVLQGNEYNITGFKVPAQTCQFLGGHGTNLIPPPNVTGRSMRV